jgi:hypothetical protein
MTADDPTGPHDEAQQREAIAHRERKAHAAPEAPETNEDEGTIS